MCELEKMAEKLSIDGFFPTLSKNSGGWNCMLMSSKTHRPAAGHGDTALGAMKNAAKEIESLLPKKRTATKVV